MRYRVELVGHGDYLTDDKHRVEDTVRAYLDNDEDVQILICVGDHEEPDDDIRYKKRKRDNRKAC